MNNNNNISNNHPANEKSEQEENTRPSNESSEQEEIIRPAIKSSEQEENIIPGSDSAPNKDDGKSREQFQEDIENIEAKIVEKQWDLEKSKSETFHVIHRIQDINNEQRPLCTENTQSAISRYEEANNRLSYNHEEVMENSDNISDRNYRQISIANARIGSVKFARDMIQEDPRYQISAANDSSLVKQDLYAANSVKELNASFRIMKKHTDEINEYENQIDDIKRSMNPLPSDDYDAEPWKGKAIAYSYNSDVEPTPSNEAVPDSSDDSDSESTSSKGKAPVHSNDYVAGPSSLKRKAPDSSDDYLAGPLSSKKSILDSSSSDNSDAEPSSSKGKAPDSSSWDDPHPYDNMPDYNSPEDV